MFGIVFMSSYVNVQMQVTCAQKEIWTKERNSIYRTILSFVNVESGASKTVRNAYTHKQFIFQTERKE